jgi:hypothetical protein
LNAYSKRRRDEINILKGNVIVDTYTQLIELIDDALCDTKSQKHLHLGVVPFNVINRINNEIINIPRELRSKLFKENKECSLEISQDSIRHLRDEKSSLKREDIIDFIKALPNIVTEFDSVKFSYFGKELSRKPGIRFEKKLDARHRGALYIVLMAQLRKKRGFRLCITPPQ